MDQSVRATEKETFAHSKCSHCGGSRTTKKWFKQQRKGKGNDKFHSSLSSRNPKNKCTERNNLKPNTCFRGGSEYHLIIYYPKLENLEKRAHWNTENPKTSANKSTKIDKSSEKSKKLN